MKNFSHLPILYTISILQISFAFTDPKPTYEKVTQILNSWNVKQCKYSPNNKLIACTTYNYGDKQAYIYVTKDYYVANNQTIKIKNINTSKIHLKYQFTQNNDFILVYYNNFLLGYQITLSGIINNTDPKYFYNHDQNIVLVKFTNNGKISLASEKKICILETVDGKLVVQKQFDFPYYSINYFVWNQKHGEIVYLNNKNQSIIMYNTSCKQQVKNITNGTVFNLISFPNGKYIISTSQNKIIFYDIQSSSIQFIQQITTDQLGNFTNPIISSDSSYLSATLISQTEKSTNCTNLVWKISENGNQLSLNLMLNNSKDTESYGSLDNVGGQYIISIFLGPLEVWKLCNKNQYFSNNKCYKCNQNCSQCRSDQNYCVNCIQKMRLSSSVCIYCNQTLPHCLYCNLHGLDCFICETGYFSYQNVTPYRCQPCSKKQTGCLQCPGDQSKDCSKCQEGYYRMLNQWYRCQLCNKSIQNCISCQLQVMLKVQCLKCKQNYQVSGQDKNLCTLSVDKQSFWQQYWYYIALAGLITIAVIVKLVYCKVRGKKNQRQQSFIIKQTSRIVQNGEQNQQQTITSHSNKSLINQAQIEQEFLSSISSQNHTNSSISDTVTSRQSNRALTDEEKAKLGIRNTFIEKQQQ